MAESLAHTFGQIIGDVLEPALEPALRKFANKHGLYLDRKGCRPARSGRKVTWTDAKGNAHDLDFVLERGGTNDAVGSPVAFIEVAWRRYTKHSRNKAQEIQGAIQALASTYRRFCPFTGVVLAGVFTDGELNQLRSFGFQVLYFSYEAVTKAFRSVGINAAFDEATAENDFRERIARWNELTKETQKKVAKSLVAENRKAVEEFFGALDKAVSRRIERVVVIPLHGCETECKSASEAIAFISDYMFSPNKSRLHKYEIQIRYNNGDKIGAEFGGKPEALEFLKQYE